MNLTLVTRNIVTTGVCLVCMLALTSDAIAKTGHNSKGPGTEMTKMINRLGLGSNCSRCRALANQMDARGPEWVRQNKQYVVQRTVSNASKLGHRMGPVKKMGVRYIVGRSVRVSSR